MLTLIIHIIIAFTITIATLFMSEWGKLQTQKMDHIRIKSSFEQDKFITHKEQFKKDILEVVPDDRTTSDIN